MREENPEKAKNGIVTIMHQQLVYIRETVRAKRRIAFACACAFIFGAILFSLNNIRLLSKAEGIWVGSLHAGIIVVLALLFGINLTLLLARITSAAEYSSNSSKSIGSTSLASALGILFSGCASCCLTLASYVGLGSFAAFLPWKGIEINLFAIALLIYSIWNLSKPVVCTVPKLKKSRNLA